jgi:hypothetical protein
LFVSISLFCLVCTGCATHQLQTDQLRTNADALSLPNNDFSIGRTLVFTNSGIVPSRVRRLKWDAEVSVATLIRQCRRPTFTHLAVTFDELPDFPPSVSRISQLSQESQDRLRLGWQERILRTLQDTTFQCDLESALASLNSDGLTVHYFIINRHNMAEMGHVDVVKCLVTNQNGRIVARTKPQYSLDYPLYFVEHTSWDYDFLL